MKAVEPKQEEMPFPEVHPVEMEEEKGKMLCHMEKKKKP